MAFGYYMVGNVLYKGGKPVMSRGIPLTVNGFLIMPDGTNKPVEELTPEEIKEWRKKAQIRLSHTMSELYRNNPQFAARINEMEDEPLETKIKFYEECPELLPSCSDQRVQEHFKKHPITT